MRVQQVLLLLGIEILEDAGGQRLRNDAEDDDLVTFGKVGHHVGEVGGGPFGEEFTQTREIS